MLVERRNGGGVQTCGEGIIHDNVTTEVHVNAGTRWGIGESTGLRTRVMFVLSQHQDRNKAQKGIMGRTALAKLLRVRVLPRQHLHVCHCKILWLLLHQYVLQSCLIKHLNVPARRCSSGGPPCSANQRRHGSTSTRGYGRGTKRFA